MSIEAIESYYSSNIHKPFYVATGDEEYLEVLSNLKKKAGIDIIRMSDLCTKDDKKPDLDKLREILREADVNCDSNKIALLGLGEYLALEGAQKAYDVLFELITFNLGSAHAVFILRGVANIVRELNKDPRVNNRQISISNSETSDILFKFSSIDLGLYDSNGFKNALKNAEDGDCTICVNTVLSFPMSLYRVQYVKMPYDAVIKKYPSIDLPKSIGTEAQWEYLLRSLNDNGSLEKIFTRLGFNSNTDSFYQNISKPGEESWMYYVFLLKEGQTLQNSYLDYVIGISSNQDDFQNKILNAISSLDHKQKGYKKLYDDRKRLLKSYPESEIAYFVSNNRLNEKESIYRLTDNTLVEKQEIIADIALQGVPENLPDLYPSLHLYMQPYNFGLGETNKRLTAYFEAYKRQKLANAFEEGFLEQIDLLATERIYNRLRTRDEIVGSLEKTDSFLCWVDALGAEYIAYIVNKAKQKGLAISVEVGRADLPTITSINKGFFDTWPQENRIKIDELDEIKHKEKGGYKYGPGNKYPIHLAKELDVIDSVINDAATNLALRHYEKYVIASDHGASRLAVIRNKEEKYETDTKGQHSGRCCKTFDNYDLPFATEENGYIVLADYGRFKGSRAANVEVHGGASLEEVIVPVITLSLLDNSLVIQLVEDVVKADHKTGIDIKLFVNKPIAQKLSVEYNGNRYTGTVIDENHYLINIPEIKRAATIQADVYLDDALVTQLTIKALSKSASVNSDFDDLF